MSLSSAAYNRYFYHFAGGHRSWNFWPRYLVPLTTVVEFIQCLKRELEPTFHLSPSSVFRVIRRLSVCFGIRTEQSELLSWYQILFLSLSIDTSCVHKGSSILSLRRNYRRQRALIRYCGRRLSARFRRLRNNWFLKGLCPTVHKRPQRSRNTRIAGVVLNYYTNQILILA